MIDFDKLYDAIYDADHSVLKQEVENGLNPNVRVEGDEWNMLHMALVSLTIPVEISIIQLLLDLGVEINAKDSNGWTPIHYAVRRKNNFSIIKQLIENGANLNIANNDAQTPLVLSIITKPFEKEVIELLLQNGADPHHRYKGSSVVQWANTYSHGEDSFLIECFNNYK
ncbi:MAG: ankyrin repeat domain-containing protein [Lentisphaeraceae bacterium]|nr:ankyrin repeat domain-containing protein [Lentisphaeraceae bacterium]